MGLRWLIDRDADMTMEIKRTPRYRIVWQILQNLRTEFVQARCADSSAALTLATLFALVPMITVLYRALEFLPEAQQLGQRLDLWLFKHLLPTSGYEVQNYLRYFADQARQLTGLSAVMLVITALLMLNRIQQAFRCLWREEDLPRTWRQQIRYWLAWALSPLLLAAGVAMTSILLSWNWFAWDGLAWEWVLDPAVSWLLSLLPLLASTLAFALINRVMATVSISWTAAWIGGGCTALAFELAKYGFALFSTTTLSKNVELRNCN
jgi:membrane protein